MAIKPFNSLGGLTVGQNLVPAIDANNNASFNDVIANGNVTFNSADFNLSGNATVAGTLGVAGAVSLSDTLTVASTTNLNYVNIASDLAVGQALAVTGATTLSSTLDVSGAAHVVGQITVDGYGVFNDGAEVNGSLEVTNDLTVSGQTTLDDTLAVTGQTELGSTLYVSGTTTLGSTLAVTGDATLSSNLAVTGTQTVGGTLGVTGAATLSNTLAVSGDTTLSSNAQVGGDLTVVGQSNLGDIANVHVLGGNAGQVLKTDGNGNLFWDQIDPMAQGDTSIDIDNVTGYINLTVNGVENVVQVTENGLTLTGTQSVTGAADFGSSVSVTGDTTVGGDLSTLGSISTSSNLSVTGTANVGSTLGVAGDTSIGGNLTVGGTIGFSGLNVQGGMVFTDNGALTQSSAIVWDGSALSVSGTTISSGQITSDAEGTQVYSTGYAQLNYNNQAYVWTDSSGVSLETDGGTVVLDGAGTLNISGTANISDQLLVNGAANLSSSLGVYGDISGQANLSIGGTGTFTGDLSTSSGLSVGQDANVSGNVNASGISASTGSFSVSLNSADLTATGQVSLGTVGNVHIDGGSYGQVLKTDGEGGLSWETNAILVNGTSNVDIPVADGNVNISIGGVANIVTVGTATTIVNNDLQVIGNLIISGSQTDVNVTNLNVQDPVITEGRGANNAPLTLNDGLDRGLHSYYFDGDAEQEKGAFIGFKNPSAASADAGKFVIASDASLTDNVATINSYADVVVNSVQSGIDGGASRVVLGEGQVTIVADDNTVVQVDPWGVQITGTNRFYGELRNNDLDETTGAQITTYATTQVAIATIADNRPGAVLEVTLRGIDVVSGKMEVNKFMVLTNAAGQVDYTGTSTLRLVGTPGAVDFITTATGVSSGDLSIVVTPASTNQTNWVATYTRML